MKLIAVLLLIASGLGVIIILSIFWYIKRRNARIERNWKRFLADRALYHVYMNSGNANGNGADYVPTWDDYKDDK